MKAFKNVKLFTGERLVTDSILLVDGKVIIGIDDQIPKGAESIDCKGGILAPGLIDLQVYGGGGYLFSSSLTADSLYAIADNLVRKGTTGFFITLATNSFDVYRKAVDIVRNNPHPAVLGIHLEGPYINPVRKGAHREEFIKKTDIDELSEFLDFSAGTIKMMTLAPEECDEESLGLLLRYKVLLSAGHSNATYEQAQEGFGKGIRAATHLFNAMSPLHHREPGLTGAVFLSEDVSAGIIPDGIHVSFEMVKVAKKIMGERLFFITDAVDEVREGAYVHIRRKDHFTLPDGTLSGSALTLPLAVKNGVERVGLPLEESLKMASLYPAKLAKLARVGRIQTGYKANLVCLTESLDLQFTVFEGEVFS